jgi:hypothetical protein
MALSIDVHLDQDKLPSVVEWQATIRKRKYPLMLPTDLDPRSPSGTLDCIYDDSETTFEYYFNDSPEISAPMSCPVSKHAVAEFRVNTGDGESAWHAAVAAAASLCIVVGGVIEDADCRHVESKRAGAWAKNILGKDDELAKQALAFPSPEEYENSNEKKSWWRFW